MKYLYLLIFIFHITHGPQSVHAGPGTGLNTGALLFGQASLDEATKHSENAFPTGQSYKLLIGNRQDRLEFNANLRFNNLDEEVSLLGQSGQLTHQSVTLGFQLGVWVFPFLSPHFGYATHAVREKVNGDFSEAQQATLKGKYKLREGTETGLYGGVDLVLLKFGNGQLFANYDYYHFNHRHAHEWEAMVGFRFYSGSKDKSKGPSGKNNFLEALLRIIFNKK